MSKNDSRINAESLALFVDVKYVKRSITYVLNMYMGIIHNFRMVVTFEVGGRRKGSGGRLHLYLKCFISLKKI